jgi:hypothetical protein
MIIFILFVFDGIAGRMKIQWEDNRSNRMQDSIDKFREIAQSKLYAALPIHLVLTRYDILPSKLEFSPINAYFPDFNGTTADDAVRFFKGLLTAGLEHRVRSSYVINCLDEKQVMNMLGDIVNIVQMDKLHSEGVMETSNDNSRFVEMSSGKRLVQDMKVKIRHLSPLATSLVLLEISSRLEMNNAEETAEKVNAVFNRTQGQTSEQIVNELQKVFPL